MNEKIFGIIAVIVVIAGGWYLLSRTPADVSQITAEEETPVTTTTTTTTTTTLVSSTGVTVTYTDQGFSPSSVTVPLGTTVTFINQSGKGMWVGADVHPTHQGYDSTTKNQHCATGYSGETPFDQCSTGASYSFTFLKAGTWEYHNHSSAGDRGTIIVNAATPI